MSTGGKDRGSREARERSRLYQARQTFHDERIRRRTRDNLIAGIGGGLVIAAIIVVQTLFFTIGPGTPAPSPTPTSTTTPAPTPAPTSTETTVPEPSATPTP
ncbi:MAG: dioxygenase [Microbacterium sp.]